VISIVSTFTADRIGSFFVWTGSVRTGSDHFGPVRFGSCW
jgi:hypothetical protein